MVCGDGQFASLTSEETVREGTDRERGLVAEIDLADVVLSDIGVDMKDGEICCDEEERAVSEPTRLSGYSDVARDHCSINR